MHTEPSFPTHHVLRIVQIIFRIITFPYRVSFGMFKGRVVGNSIVLREVIKLHKPTILALVKTHVGDNHAQKLLNTLILMVTLESVLKDLVVGFGCTGSPN